MNLHLVSFTENFPQNNINTINFSLGRGYSFIQQLNSTTSADIIFTTTASTQRSSLIVALSSTTQSPDIENTDLLKFIVWGILGSFLAVLGFLGNTVSMVVLHRPQMRSSTSYYLISLAIYDNCILFSMMIYFCLPAMAPFVSSLKDYKSVSAHTIIVGYPLSLTAQMGSIYTCVAFTVERFIAVCWPLHAANTCTKSRTVRAIILIVLWSLAYNIPRFFHYRIIYPGEDVLSQQSSNSFDVTNSSFSGATCKEFHNFLNTTSNCSSQMSFSDKSLNIPDFHIPQTLSNLTNSTPWIVEPRGPSVKRITDYVETEFGAGHIFKHVYLIYSQLVFMFLVPFLIILIMNVGLIRAVRVSKSMQESMCASARKEHNLTVMLIAVIMVFLICQFPTIIDNILVAVMGENELKINYSYMCFYIVCTFMVEINAAFNFLLYCFFGKKFRIMLLSTLGLRDKYHHVTYRSTVCKYRVSGSQTYDMEMSVV